MKGETTCWRRTAERTLRPAPGLVVFLAALVAVLVPAPLIPAQEAARTLSCKSWPAGYFLTEDSRKPAQWKRLLRLLERELAGLNARGECLVVKGTIIEPLETTRRYYDTITILDESGLKVVVRRMPNLYYRYPGLLGPMHKNVFLVARNLRLQEADSRLTGSFLVAGDFVAYASKYLEALGKYWGNGAPSEKEDD